MTTKQVYYRIYLLTVWQEQSRGPPESLIWRFRLEGPRTGQQQVFADATYRGFQAQMLRSLPLNAAESGREEGSYDPVTVAESHSPVGGVAG